jgi:hypothetical protein
VLKIQQRQTSPATAQFFRKSLSQRPCQRNACGHKGRDDHRFSQCYWSCLVVVVNEADGEEANVQGPQTIESVSLSGRENPNFEKTSKSRIE